MALYNTYPLIKKYFGLRFIITHTQSDTNKNKKHYLNATNTFLLIDINHLGNADVFNGNIADFRNLHQSKQYTAELLQNTSGNNSKAFLTTIYLFFTAIKINDSNYNLQRIFRKITDNSFTVKYSEE